MKNPQKQVPYETQGKRLNSGSVATEAGRQAKNRTARSQAEKRLRDALGNPTDTKGKPLAAHSLTLLAAERFNNSGSKNPAADFDFTAAAFLKKLSYKWGEATSVSALWKTFLELVKVADQDLAKEFVQNFETAFRWCVAGHVHRMKMEYQNQPSAIVQVETSKTKDGFMHVGVQRDGRRRMMPLDRPPNSPEIFFAGTKLHHFIAPQDLAKIAEIEKRKGVKHICAMLKSGEFKYSTPPEELVVEDILLNVAPPNDQALADVAATIFILRYKPKPKKQE